MPQSPHARAALDCERRYGGAFVDAQTNNCGMLHNKGTECKASASSGPQVIDFIPAVFIVEWVEARASLHAAACRQQAAAARHQPSLPSSPQLFQSSAAAPLPADAAPFLTACKQSLAKGKRE
jgi:hypothetical protein